jgi:hypothetical protein
MIISPIFVALTLVACLLPNLGLDSTPPTATITLASSEASIAGTASSSHFVVTWSEPIQSFNISGACHPSTSGTPGGSVTSITQTSSTVYEVTVTGYNASGSASLVVSSGSCLDIAGNTQTVTATSPTITVGTSNLLRIYLLHTLDMSLYIFVVQIDATIPTVTLTSSMDIVTQIMTFVATFARSVTPSTFESCISWSGALGTPASLNITTKANNSTYTIALYYPTSGTTGSVVRGNTRTLTIPSGCIYDLVGNTSPGGSISAAWDDSSVLILHGSTPTLSMITSGDLNLTLAGGDVVVTGNVSLQGWQILQLPSYLSMLNSYLE